MADHKKGDKKDSAPKKAKKKSGPKPYKQCKSCPKCGAGVRLGEHKDRRACGKCGYFEKK